MRPRWEALRTDAVVVAGLVFLDLIVMLIFERLYIMGAARFYWQAIAGGWLSVVIAAWACYLVRNEDAEKSKASTATSAAHLFTMILAQSVTSTAAMGLLFTILIRTEIYPDKLPEPWGIWFLWLLPGIWMVAAELILLWRGGDRRRIATVFAALAVCGATVVSYSIDSKKFWYPKPDKEEAARPSYLKLTQRLMETQPQLLKSQLSELKPQRRGVIDFYAITFAPYAQDVFRRESDMVAQVMVRRYDAEGRVLQLVNHVDTAEKLPWATQLNLQRAIQRVAQLMDRDEDILFIHMTSHGASDGELAASFWPMTVEPLHPGELKKWLDEAGIRYRVISVSACYSGSWVTPLANESTLIMTAADADHTSYGCGSKSELTFFGRAMYDEQLRNVTLSFEDAHKTAREVIEQREKEAGKSDGYSNPQLRAGATIRERLAALQMRLQNSSTRQIPAKMKK
ncbi:MAG: hypothetical protein HYS18_10725 [Burkholderiales bacterium]|nr:hypothetical protein [Burkholderiales bacterium]